MQLKLSQHDHDGQQARHRNRSAIALANVGHSDYMTGTELPRRELFAQFMSELRKEMQAARAEEARLLLADIIHISQGGNLRKTPSGTDYIFWGKIGEGGIPDLLDRIEEEAEKCREPVVISRTDFSTRYRFSRWLLRNGHVTPDDMDEFGLVIGKSA